MEYVTLDAAGIDGNMYGGGENIGVTESYKPPRQMPSANCGYKGPIGRSAVRENFTKQMFYDDATFSSKNLDGIQKVTGQFGQDNFRAWVEPTCPQYSYEQAMAQVAQQQRTLQGANLGGHWQNMRSAH
jgi:hypothetical protein